MNKMRILLVDDEIESLRSMELTLNIAGFEEVMKCVNADLALKAMHSTTIDMAVFDIMMPNISGIELLKKFKEIDPDIPIIMATGVHEIEIAVQCMRDGAFDYVLKPFESERFISGIRNALHLRELQKENQNLRNQLLASELNHPEIFDPIITQSNSMIGIFRYIEAISQTPHPVLITGETGVGKELIAKAIHTVSNVEGEFVAVNVAGIDDTTFSDTLFGHAKGAFTGAESIRKGLIETAANGTLFLDEIGDLSLQSQVKLLRLIQEREYRQLGSDITRRCNARIVTATCRNIESCNDEKIFRRDLYYRLRTHHIALPPLRSRKNDIEPLVRYFVTKAAIETNKPQLTIPRELFTLLSNHNFPGNIRELQTMIYDAVALQKGNTLSLQSFKNKLNIASSETSDSMETKSIPSPIKHVTFGEQLPTLRDMEDLLLEEALNRTNGNQSLAANLLGITRQAVGQRIKKK